MSPNKCLTFLATKNRALKLIIHFFLLQEPMKSKAPQLHLEYRFYKLLGSHGKLLFNT